MGFTYVYFCCQCNDGPKVLNVQPRCVLCNHPACTNCKPASSNVNPGLSSANTEQNNVYRRRKEDTEKEYQRQASHHRDQRRQASLKNPDYTRSSAPADAESIVAVQNQSVSYDINHTAERIAFVLFSDYEIRVLCKNALEVDNRRSRLLSSLLKTYGEELEETPGDIYTITGQFIRSFPGSTANAVVRSLDPTLLNPEDTGESGIPQHLFPRYTTGLNEKADDYEESSLLALQRFDLDDLHTVLLVGRASKNLRHNLHLFVHPNKELGKFNYLLPDLSNILYRLKQTIDRWLRPGVKKGYMRAEWECICGYVMYRDLKTRSTRKRDWFLKKVAPPQSQRRDFHHIATPSASSNTANSNLSQTQTSGTDSLDGSRITRSKVNPMLQFRCNSSDSENPAVGPALRQRSSAPYLNKKKFLELCINTGKYTISLGEIAVGNVGADGELFSEIRKRYYELRPMCFRRLFYHPADIHYVCFSLHRTHRVGIHRKPLDLPPEEESKNYEYIRCQFPPPMDPREFLHYFYGHDGSHPFQTYLSRLPKKVERSMYQEQSENLVFGWGLHIIEGPNKALLLWIVCAILVLSGVVSVVYAVVMKSEEQGFGIGQWIVAVLSTALAALYYQWEHV